MKKVLWSMIWNEPKVAEGGRGTWLVTMLKDNGIRARACSSCYVGHIGVEVQASMQKKALKICQHK